VLPDFLKDFVSTLRSCRLFSLLCNSNEKLCDTFWPDCHAKK